MQSATVMAIELQGQWELRQDKQSDDREEGVWRSCDSGRDLLEWNRRDSQGNVEELGGVGFFRDSGVVLRLRFRTGIDGTKVYADIVSPRASHDALYWGPELLEVGAAANTFLDAQRPGQETGVMRPVLTVHLQSNSLGDVGGQIVDLVLDENWMPWLMTDIYDYSDRQRLKYP